MELGVSRERGDIRHLSVVQANQFSVLACSIPCGFLSWGEGRAGIAFQGLSTTGQIFFP